MTEAEAKEWVAARFPAGRITLLERFAVLLRSAADQQSLIARSTFEHLWSRHIVDSAQLVGIAPAEGRWLDVGSGGGLPGLVIAILRDTPVTLCEPRRKRVEFLTAAIEDLGLVNAQVSPGNVQNIHGKYDFVTARAVGSIDDIFAWTAKAVSRETLYVLQRGRNWQEDVASAKRAWHGAFHVEQSITDPDAGVVCARAVCRR